MKKIIFLTNYKSIIPQRNNEIEGLKLNLISKELEAKGFIIQEMTISSFISVLNKNENIKFFIIYFFIGYYSRNTRQSDKQRTNN